MNSIRKCIAGILSLAMLTAGVAQTLVSAQDVEEATADTSYSDTVLENAEKNNKIIDPSVVFGVQRYNESLNRPVLAEGTSPDTDATEGQHEYELKDENGNVTAVITYTVNFVSVDGYTSNLAEIASLKSYNGGEVVIPDKLPSIDADGNPNQLYDGGDAPDADVAFIDPNAFLGSTVTSVVLPSTLVRLGQYAFCNCMQLESVTFNEPADPETASNLMICDDAFYTCPALKTVKLPHHLNNVGKEVFASCPSLESVTIPSSLKTTGDSMFANDINLADLTIEDGVQKINNSTFSGCAALTQVTIPSSVTSIKSSAFQYTGLTSVVIPDTVTTVSSFAFFKCDKLKDVTLSKGMSYIANNTFALCTSLENVVIPDTITSIKTSAFSTSGLKEITIPDTITSLSTNAFISCPNLTSVKLPSTITTIPEACFSGCSALTSIDIPESVTTIKPRAFAGCTSLATLNIPDSVTSIDTQAFLNDTALTDVSIGSGITKLPDSAFNGCSLLKNVTIADTVTSIGEKAFLDCPSLTTLKTTADSADGEVTLPTSLKTIGNYAFMNTGISKVNLNTGLESIGKYSFCDTPSLKDLTLPKSEVNSNKGFYVNERALGYKTSLIKKDNDDNTNDDNEELEDNRNFAIVDGFTVTGHHGTNVENYVLNANNGSSKNKLIYNCLEPEYHTTTTTAETTTETTATQTDITTTEPASETTEPASETTEPATDITTVTTETTEPSSETTEPASETVTTETPTETGSEPAVSKYGDVDDNNDVNVADVVLLNKYLVGADTITPQGKSNAACLNDGKLDSKDSSAILAYLASLCTYDELPVTEVPADK